MTIVIPIEQKRFYYNRKINCLPAEGYIQYGDEHEELHPHESLGSLDWGRGVWAYRSFWNWASASGFLPDGRRVGLNLGMRLWRYLCRHRELPDPGWAHPQAGAGALRLYLRRLHAALEVHR